MFVVQGVSLTGMGEVSGRWFGYQGNLNTGDLVTGVDGWRLLVDRILVGGHEPAHAAAEMDVSRQCAYPITGAVSR